MSDDLTALTGELRSVNERLWDIEDAIRCCEFAGDFGQPSPCDTGEFSPPSGPDHPTSSRLREFASRMAPHNRHTPCDHTRTR